MKATYLLASAALALLTTACSATTTSNPSTVEANNFASLLTNVGRPADDLKDDAGRKPAEVLSFMDVKTGQTVFEMEAGGGYYTELLSGAVGASGKVYMQNPAVFDTFLNGADKKRIADNRLPNVEHVSSQFDALPAPTGSVDLVTWVLGPHEVYFIPEGTEGLGNAAKTYAEIARILKPGGSFVAIDHVAVEGSGKEAGHSMHRIEKSIVIEEAKAAGLMLTDSSPILENSTDPLAISPFDPSVRRKTNRFLLKFSKPE